MKNKIHLLFLNTHIVSHCNNFAKGLFDVVDIGDARIEPVPLPNQTILKMDTNIKVVV